ncbi:hypothetical protein [Streptomyces sp. Ac-502]|uniref:hypothetical protein n=1 Tax=Streptomyces sp. Ac-502 TaxID=3342801 RepID=UPI003862785A
MMPRITLAHWHGDAAPGDTIDVTDEELAGLARDGRIAAVHDAPPPVRADAGPQAPAERPRKDR